MAGSAVEYGLLPDLIAAIEDKVPGIAVTHFPLFNIIPVQHDGWVIVIKLYFRFSEFTLCL